MTVERGPDDALLVTAIERLPFDLTGVANRARELDEPETSFVIDGVEGLGAALYAALGSPGRERWRL